MADPGTKKAHGTLSGEPVQQLVTGNQGPQVHGALNSDAFGFERYPSGGLQR